jgi:predicted methyltransferase
MTYLKTLSVSALTLTVALTLAACGQGAKSVNGDEAEAAKDAAESTVEQTVEETAATMSLADAVAGDWRSEDQKARDEWRHPAETLEFLGLTPGMTVVEVFPGGGWYTQIIAPYIASGGGTYVAAGFDPDLGVDYYARGIAKFDETFVSNPERYGDIIVTALSASSGPIAEPGSADMVLTFRNVHNWMKSDYADKAFADMYAALKPGGILGVVEHRAKADAEQDPKADSGYVREDYTIALAEKAGFVLESTSEINANPKDSADHPSGVWSLPPTLAKGDASDEDYDAEIYKAIGESDRMTLKFRKPAQ